MGNGKIMHLIGQLRPVAIGSTILVLMVTFSGACGQQTPIPTPTPTSSPLWSEQEAIAVVKATCGNRLIEPDSNSCDSVNGEWIVNRPTWSAEYDSEERRWVVTMSDLETLFGRNLDTTVVSYAYENTQTVEWHVNR